VNDRQHVEQAIMDNEMDNEITQAVTEIQQSRSRFQLEHFVVGQHDTPEMRFYQICLELQDLEYKLAHASLEEQELELKIQKLREKNTPIAHVKADKKELGLRQLRLVKVGAEREIAILRDLFHESPKYTRDQIEQAQPEYWTKRLTRQYQLQQAGGRIGVGWAQLDAMIQADIMERPALPTSNTTNEIAS
jgi:hypothetical protein